MSCPIALPPCDEPTSRYPLAHSVAEAAAITLANAGSHAETNTHAFDCSDCTTDTKTNESSDAAANAMMPVAEGVDETGWQAVRLASQAAVDAAEDFLATAKSNVSMDDFDTFNQTKFDAVSAKMTAYFGKQGALDKAHAALDWTEED